MFNDPDNSRKTEIQPLRSETEFAELAVFSQWK